VYRCPDCQRYLLPGAICPWHAQHRAPADDIGPAEAPDVELEGYSGFRQIGRGGFAVVYAARCQADGAAVAVKVALRARDARFEREARALSQLSRPHAPALRSHGILGDRPYLVMDLIGGRALTHWLAARPRVVSSLREASTVFASLCEAAQHVHEAGLVHRDLKPDNSILHEAGVTLLDFGLAEISGAEVEADDVRLTATGQRIGTASYMSPEQCRAEASLDARSDLYALGVIWFELVCGRPPFSGSPAEVMRGHATLRPPLPSDFAEVPGAVDELSRRFLAKEPQARYSTASEMAAAMQSALAEAPVAIVVRAAKRARPSATQEVALLALRADVPVGRIGELARAERGELTTSEGGWYVVGFPHAPSAQEGMRAALRVASRASESAELCVAHVAPLRVRHGKRGTRMVGAAVSRPETWLPGSDAAEPAADAGCVVTHQARAYLQQHACVVEVVPGFHTVETDSETPPQTVARRVPARGIDELTGDIAERVRQGHREAIPTLVTIVGEPGHGKTRVLDEVRAALGGGAARVVRVAAEPAGAETRSLLQRLLRLALDLPDEPSAARVEAACARLPGEAQRPSWPAVAHAMGLRSEGSAELMLAAPGALRQTLAVALGNGLRRLAEREPFALLVDDAHLADLTVLDALEAATLAEHRVPICIVVAALPRLQELRGEWADRAGSASRHDLAPLADGAARELLLDLLAPVEFVADQIAEAILERTGRVPLHLVEFAGSLRAEGAIRQLRGTDSHYLAAEDLLHVSSTPIGEVLARRILGGESPAMRWLLQVCAVLGERFDAEEVDEVLQLADRAGRVEVDPSIGLAKLVAQRALRRIPGGFSFRHPMVREAIVATASPQERQALHDAARQRLAARGTLSRRGRAELARHAAASGAREEAMRAYLELAGEAAAEHRAVDAEQHYTSALANLTEGDLELRERALGGRGKARCRLRRLGDALEDLRAAADLAEARGDTAATVDLLLEQATVLDWEMDFTLSAEVVWRARDAAGDLSDPLLCARLHHGEARSHLRAERIDEAIDAYDQAITGAEALGDYETQMTSLLLLAPALVYADRLADAEARFGQVIELCTRAGDRLHLGAALANRMVLWMKRPPAWPARSATCSSSSPRSTTSPSCACGWTSWTAQSTLRIGRATSSGAISSTCTWSVRSS